MRTLSDELIAEQQKDSATPYVRLQFKLTGEDNVVFDTGDSPNRILSVDDWEEPFTGGCVVRIRNDNQYFKTRNWKGEKLVIGWGFVIGEGHDASNNRTLYIINQRDISMEGELITEFICVDNWARIASTLLITAGVKLTGTMEGAFEISETITGNNSGATGKVTGAGSNYITVISVSGDGDAAEFATDTEVVGGTSGAKIISLSTADQSASGGGEWPRDTSILNILKSILGGLVVDVVVDSDDPTVAQRIGTYQPLLSAETGTRVRGVVRQLLQKVKYAARMENDDKLHTLYLDTGAAAQYTYDSDHAFKVDIREEAAILPNQVLFVDRMPDATNVAQYFGTAQSDDRDIGNFLTIEVDPTIQNNDEAAARAAAWIAHREAEAHQGTVLAPMHCGQELYDMVEVTDTRADVTVKGRVGRIDRHYASGRYEIELRLGGILTTPGAAVPGPDFVDWDIKDIATTTRRDRVTLRKAVYPWQLWKAVQPYVTDIDFSSVDKNHISWTAGKIYFADGSKLTINLKASLSIPNPGWLYFTEGSATLTYTTSFADCVAPTHGLVAFVAPGAETGQTALIWPASGKEPLLNADVITCMTLSALTANVGTLTAGIIEGVVMYGGSRAFRLDDNGLYMDLDAVPLKIYDGDFTDGGDYAGEIDVLGNRDVRLRSRDNYGLNLESDEDIELDPGSHDIWSSDDTDDIGTSSYPFDDVNAYDFIDRSPSPRKVEDALAKIKAMTTHMHSKIRKGAGRVEFEAWERNSFPPDILRPILQRDTDGGERKYQKKLKVKDSLQRRLNRRKAMLERLNAIGQAKLESVGKGHLLRDVLRDIQYVEEDIAHLETPVRREPKVGVSMVSTIGLLLSAIKELTEKVEKLEAKQ